MNILEYPNWIHHGVLLDQTMSINPRTQTLGRINILWQTMRKMWQ